MSDNHRYKRKDLDNKLLSIFLCLLSISVYKLDEHGYDMLMILKCLIYLNKK